jgi:dynein heavy chain
LWKVDVNEAFVSFLETAVIQEKIPFDTSFDEGNATANAVESYQPNNDTTDDRGYWINTRINLELFSENIKKYLQVQAEVAELRQTYDSDFLKINAQPVKQAISMLATKWLYVHTQYLQNFVSDQLLGLHKFYHEVNLHCSSSSSLLCPSFSHTSY